MSKHSGIVGVSAEGTALCYRTICVEGQPDRGLPYHLGMRHLAILLLCGLVSEAVAAAQRGEVHGQVPSTLDRTSTASGAGRE